MTLNEFKEQLRLYSNAVQYTDPLIDSMETYLNSLIERGFSEWSIRYTRDYLVPVMERERNRQSHARNQITSWSELIANETYRSMFVDHYLNGLTDDQIERKYHYSRTSIFHIRKKVIMEINEKLVINLEPGDQSLQAVE